MRTRCLESFELQSRAINLGLCADFVLETRGLLDDPHPVLLEIAGGHHRSIREGTEPVFGADGIARCDELGVGLEAGLRARADAARELTTRHADRLPVPELLNGCTLQLSARRSALRIDSEVRLREVDHR